MSSTYSVIGKDPTSHAVVAQAYVAVTSGGGELAAAIAAAIATQQFIDAGIISGTNCQAIEVSNNLPTIARDQARESTQIAIKALLPAALTAGSALKVGVIDSLPAGTANIGKVTPIDTAAPHFATGQATVNAEVDIVPIRATRRRVLITNQDPTNTIFIGTTGVLTTTGFALLPGKTEPFKALGLIRGIPSAGSPVASYWEEYD
jgi:hypothetical protein